VDLSQVPNLVCVQQVCTQCEEEPNIDQVCERCRRRKHTFWEADPVGELLNYLWEPRSWANKVVAIARNAKAYDLHFILNRAILLKRQPELIMNGQKIMSMRDEYLHFLDSVSYLPMPLRKLLKHSVYRLQSQGTLTFSIPRKTCIM
jgi:hypothetical protein